MVIIFVAVGQRSMYLNSENGGDGTSQWYFAGIVPGNLSEMAPARWS